jgi:co-chaperonin GroES (HSP10)
MSKPSLLKGAKIQPELVEPKGPRLKLEMVGCWILIDLPNELGDKVEGGVIVPESARRRLQPIIPAEVLSVGPDVAQIKKGDQVLVRRVDANHVPFDGQSYFMVMPTSVLAIIPKGP